MILRDILEPYFGFDDIRLFVEEIEKIYPSLKKPMKFLKKYTTEELIDVSYAYRNSGKYGICTDSDDARAIQKFIKRIKKENKEKTQVDIKNMGFIIGNGLDEPDE